MLTEHALQKEQAKASEDENNRHVRWDTDRKRRARVVCEGLEYHAKSALCPTWMAISRLARVVAGVGRWRERGAEISGQKLLKWSR